MEVTFDMLVMEGLISDVYSYVFSEVCDAHMGWCVVDQSKGGD